MKVQKLKNNKVKKTTNKKSVVFSYKIPESKNGIRVILSKEHGNYTKDIEECFGDLNVIVEAGYVRKSIEELPMQVLIFLAEKIRDGVIYDLLKKGIKKVRKKFKKVGIRITDKNQNVYNINLRGQINIFLVPNGKTKLISNIATIDDLFKYLQNQNNGWQIKKIKEIGEVITGKTPSKNNPEDWGYKMPFITPTDYKAYRKTAFSASRNLSENGINRLSKKILPIKSSMVTCIGSDMGKVCMNGLPVITNQQINSIIPDTNVIDSDFLYYKLVSIYDKIENVWERWYCCTYC